jgi:uncharacterized membrane protein YdjX (TVP38/TMEM64 family)
MIVDDRYLRVGSSNINNRSMTLDTECDLVIEGNDAKTRKKIAAVRNDLIREHTGRSIASIQALIDEGANADVFLQEVKHSRQHMRRVNDEPYRKESLTSLATRFADPEKPLLPSALFTFRKRKNHSNKKRAFPTRLILVILFIIALALVWKVTPLSEYATPEKVVPILESVRNTPWALPAGLAFYVIGTLIFFPHMIMTATIVILFAPLQAFAIAMLGSLISGAIGFFAGRKLGPKSLRTLIGDSAKKVSHYAQKGGLLGVTLLRMLPIAPYTVVNMALGMMEISFFIFLAATVLGLLPGTLVSVFLGHSVLELWQNPELENFLYVGAGMAAWIGVIALSHFLAKRWQKSKAASK